MSEPSRFFDLFRENPVILRVVTTTEHRHESRSDQACCVAFDVEPLEEAFVEDLAAGYKALGDPHRMSILHLLSAVSQPVCVIDIEHHLPVGQSTVSYHLKFLVDAGLLTRERKGRWSYYTVVPERLTQLGLGRTPEYSHE